MIRGVLRVSGEPQQPRGSSLWCASALAPDFKKPVSVRQVNCSQSFKGNWHEIASLTMSAVSSTFRAHLSEHSEKSAISLSLMVLPFPTQARL